MPDSYQELERKLRPLAKPLPAPRPGDWLAEHDEPGQTFAEYLDALPVRKSDELHTIYLCLVGDFNDTQQRVLDLTRDYLSVFFDCPVKVRRQIALASIPARARRTHPSWGDPQVLTSSILQEILTLAGEEIYLTRGPGFPAGEPLIARAAVHALEILDTTLDPGGFRQLDGSRAPIFPSLALRYPYGFAGPNEESTFKPTPEIHVQRSITGPLLLDSDYLLFLTNSIVDAGKGVGAAPGNAFAISGATDSVKGWGPPTTVSGATFFGRVRVEYLSGQGGIWVHTLEVLDNQKGCIKFSYFSGNVDRLPQNHACVKGTEATLRFTSEAFGDPAYGQLTLTADFRIRERGPGDDAMGAFGFLLDAHKWRNLQIRFREFMPVGVRPLLIAVT